MFLSEDGYTVSQHLVLTILKVSVMMQTRLVWHFNQLQANQTASRISAQYEKGSRLMDLDGQGCKGQAKL